MEKLHVDGFAKLHKVLGRYRKDNRWIFRGHSDPNWPLRPKVGRDEFVGCDDESIFRAWKRRAVEFISLPFEDDWGWLAIAQHHGLATRLLDWTFNPLAAAFFAVNQDLDAEAVVYAFKPQFVVTPETTKPFEVKGVLKFKPAGVAPRIIRQGGIFTIHEKPPISLENLIGKEDELEKIIIAKTYRRELVFELSHYGINNAALFPDLDGLSAHVNWFTRNRKYWSTLVELQE